MFKFGELFSLLNPHSKFFLILKKPMNIYPHKLLIFAKFRPIYYQQKSELFFPLEYNFRYNMYIAFRRDKKILAPFLFFDIL